MVSLRLLAVLFEISLAGGNELVIPFLAEALSERLLKELIGTDAELAAVGKGTLAYFPLVEIHGCELIVFSDSHGVEVARDGLAERDFSLATGFLDGTEAYSPGGIASESAVSPPHDGSHAVALAVNVAHAVLLKLALSCRGEIIPNHGEDFLDSLSLLFSDRGAGITLDAALTLALLEIAAEELFNKVKAHECILYLKHNSFACFGCHRLKTVQYEVSHEAVIPVTRQAVVNRHLILISGIVEIALDSRRGNDFLAVINEVAVVI